MKGWISLWRKIFENPIVPPAKVFSKFEAWVWILLNVNHRQGKVVIGNEIIHIPTGSRVTSIKKLCKTFGWGNTKVRNFLKLLAKDGMIEYKSNTHYTMVSVCNYLSYQKKQTPANTKATHTQHTPNKQANTNNNELDKERIREIRKKHPVLKDALRIQFKLWWQDYPRKEGKKNAEKSFGKLLNWERKLAINNLESHRKHWISNGVEMKFIPLPATWLNQGRYDDELSDKSLVDQRQQENSDKNMKRQREEWKKNREDSATPQEIRKIIDDVFPKKQGDSNE